MTETSPVRTPRKTEVGRVTSAKMQQTIVVEVPE